MNIHINLDKLNWDAIQSSWAVNAKSFCGHVIVKMKETSEFIIHNKTQTTALVAFNLLLINLADKTAEIASNVFRLEHDNIFCKVGKIGTKSFIVLGGLSLLNYQMQLRLTAFYMVSTIIAALSLQILMQKLIQPTIEYCRMRYQNASEIAEESNEQKVSKKEEEKEDQEILSEEEDVPVPSEVDNSGKKEEDSQVPAKTNSDIEPDNSGKKEEDDPVPPKTDSPIEPSKPDNSGKKEEDSQVLSKTDSHIEPSKPDDSGKKEDDSVPPKTDSHIEPSKPDNSSKEEENDQVLPKTNHHIQEKKDIPVPSEPINGEHEEEEIFISSEPDLSVKKNISDFSNVYHHIYEKDDVSLPSDPDDNGNEEETTSVGSDKKDLETSIHFQVQENTERSEVDESSLIRSGIIPTKATFVQDLVEELENGEFSELSF